jgi:hypothetical protein
VAVKSSTGDVAVHSKTNETESKGTVKKTRNDDSPRQAVRTLTTESFFPAHANHNAHGPTRTTPTEQNTALFCVVGLKFLHLNLNWDVCNFQVTVLLPTPCFPLPLRSVGIDLDIHVLSKKKWPDATRRLVT